MEGLELPLGRLAGREGGVGEWGSQEDSCGICGKAAPECWEGLQGSSTRSAGTRILGFCRQKPLPQGAEKSKMGEKLNASGIREKYQSKE